ncbi:class I SAM-dependent methyltransferase [Deinococcus radiomollis]|uniref:class I SAM-dependent methyltransferase n=1 Tax=Deinococcus radiomollis TaxID=468916 RepID=UPI0038926891
MNVARQRTVAGPVTFRHDDAQVLASVTDASVDIVVSKLAIIDIADHRALFHAARRVLTPKGRFVFSLLHPCFEAPFHVPDALPFLEDEYGMQVARVVRTYTTEGQWFSGGDGVRGRVGAYHRTLSTPINDLLASGFTLCSLNEPCPDLPGVIGEIPHVLLIEAQVA